MNCLLDTHTFLWAAFSPAKLSAKARKEIRSAENRVCLSTVSFWEISLKFALGKIDLVNCNPDAYARHRGANAYRGYTADGAGNGFFPSSAQGET